MIERINLTNVSVLKDDDSKELAVLMEIVNFVSSKKKKECSNFLITPKKLSQIITQLRQWELDFDQTQKETNNT